MSEKTVRVRIAVAVSDDGKWVSFGNNYCGDTAKRLNAMADARWDTKDNPTHVFFIEGEYVLPTSPTVEGSVEP